MRRFLVKSVAVSVSLGSCVGTAAAFPVETHYKSPAFDNLSDDDSPTSSPMFDSSVRGAPSLPFFPTPTPTSGPSGTAGGAGGGDGGSGSSGSTGAIIGGVIGGAVGGILGSSSSGLAGGSSAGGGGSCGGVGCGGSGTGGCSGGSCYGNTGAEPNPASFASGSNGTEEGAFETPFRAVDDEAEEQPADATQPENVQTPTPTSSPASDGQLKPQYVTPEQAAAMAQPGDTILYTAPGTPGLTWCQPCNALYNKSQGYTQSYGALTSQSGNVYVVNSGYSPSSFGTQPGMYPNIVYK